MKVFARIFVCLIGGGFIGLLGYHAYQQGWSQVAPLELQLAPGSHNEYLFAKIKDSVNTRLKKWQGKWLWEADLREIHTEVLADTRVMTASVSRVFPNKIRIRVEPHEPVFGLLDTRGKFHPVSGDGSLLPAIAPTELSSIPLLRGLQFFDNEDLRRQAVNLFKSLPEEGMFSQKNVSELKHSPREGFKLFLVEPAVQVLVGDGPLGPKSERVEQVIHYLNSRHIEGRIIDARMSKKVVVKIRQ